MAPNYGGSRVKKGWAEQALRVRGGVYAGMVGDDESLTSDVPRRLAGRERVLFDYLLTPSFPGVKELRLQLEDVRVVAVSRRKGLTRLQLASPDDAAPAPLFDELPVEAQVRNAWPPQKLCLYVQDGLLDALELVDFDGAVVPDLPDPADLEPPWCHRPAAPLPDGLCSSLSRSLTKLAPSGIRVHVSATPEGYYVEVRHGRLGMTKAGMGAPNDDERQSVIAILDFVQRDIASHEDCRWPALTELHEPKPDRPFAPPPADMDARRRFFDAHSEWVRRLPRPGAAVNGDSIRAWYGSPDHPDAELDLRS